MGNKTIFAIVMVLVAILALVIVFNAAEAPAGNCENMNLTVYSEGPIELSKIIEDVETGSYYEVHTMKDMTMKLSIG